MVMKSSFSGDDGDLPFPEGFEKFVVAKHANGECLDIHLTGCSFLKS